MRILRLIDSMNPLRGGPSQGIRHSVKQQTAADIYNEVVCLDNPTEDYIGSDPFPVHAIGPGKGPWHYSSSLVPWLIENLPRFDVMIVHGLWLYSSYAAMVAVSRLKRTCHIDLRYFVMPHGMLDPYFQLAGSRRIKAVRNWFYWKLIEHRVVEKANGVLFTTQTELELARRPFRPYYPKREINVGYGIEAPPVYSKSMQNAFRQVCPHVPDSPYLLFLSRINYKKGVDMLIQAYADILKEYINDTSLVPNLVVAGPSSDNQFGQYIKDLVATDSLLVNRVFFTGVLAGNAKWGALYGCESFVLPSHQENFGIAVVEALACGKPVLISNQVNIWREIEGGRGGLIADDTQEGIEQLLRDWLLMSVAAKNTMSRHAREIFENRYTIQKATLNLINAIQNISTISIP